MLRAIAAGDPYITWRSGRRVGKTTTLAWAAQWFETTRLDARTLVTAPSAGQLEDAFVPEFRKWVNRLPDWLRDLWELKKERFEFRFDERQPFDNFITIKTARKDSPESVQGMNAPNVLVLIDEAAGVDESIWTSLSGSLGGEESFGQNQVLLTGNPNRTSGFFFTSHNRDKEHWTTFHTSSVECEMVSRRWIAEMEREHGRDSDPFRVHVQGEFPVGESNAVIPLALVESAVLRDVEPIPDAPIIWGVDVARFGDDRSALCKRRGNVLLGNIQTWKSLDTVQLAGLVHAEYEAAAHNYKPQAVHVDVIGIGAGVVDNLRRLGVPVRGVNVAEAPSLKGQHLNLRAELWFEMKAWLEQLDVRLPNDEELRQELVAVRYEYTPSGKIKLERKRDMAKSPDKADALALTFATNAAKMGGKRYHWDKPILRRIPRLA